MTISNNAKTIFIFLLPVLLLFSCGQSDPNDELDEGFISDETYTNDEIGWSMDVPRGWTITTRQELQESNDRGKELVQENTEIIIDDSGLKHLLNFEGDNEGDSFLSNIEYFPIENKEEWDENQDFVYELIQNAYKAEGIDFESERYTERVDDLVFNVIKLELFGQSGDLILTQIVYTRHILDYNFGATLNFTNEEAKKTLYTSWRTSKFSIRK